MAKKKVKMVRMLFEMKLEMKKNQKNQKHNKCHILNPGEVLGRG